MTALKISVVMPSYNQGAFVEEALLSFFGQDYPNKELLLIDGGSSDDTARIVNRYRERLAYFVSERDRGQSDALRKGFERATGDVLTWLSTDDLLLPGILSEVASIFAGNPDTKWVFGNVIWIDAAGTILHMRKGEADNALARGARLISACGPSAFFRRELFQNVGGIDQNLHYKMDTELWLRFREAGENFRRTERYAWALRLHEDAKVGSQSFAPSIADKHRAAIAKETAALQQRYRLPKTRASRFLSNIAASAPKLVSRAWWSSREDRKRWLGKHISEFVGHPDKVDAS